MPTGRIRTSMRAQAFIHHRCRVRPDSRVHAHPRRTPQTTNHLPPRQPSNGIRGARRFPPSPSPPPLNTAPRLRLTSLFSLPSLSITRYARRRHAAARRRPLPPPRPLLARPRAGRLPLPVPGRAAEATPEDLQPRVRPPVPDAKTAPPRGAPC